MLKKGTWLTKRWLDQWQQMTTSSRWQRGRTIYQQKRLFEIQVEEGKITGNVKGGEPYRQQITCERIEESQLEKVKEIFLDNPSLVLQVYLKTTNTEMLQEHLRSLFYMPKLRFTCSCADEVSPCKHLVALAMATAAEMEKDPAKYLLFRGIPWNSILQLLGSKEPSIEQEQKRHVQYSMVPLPPQVKELATSKKGRTSPPFWVSPFPFTLMMEEIYSKVEEEADEEESSH